LYKFAIASFSIRDQITVYNRRFSRIAATASLLDFPQFPEFSPRDRVFAADCNDIAQPATAIFPDGREFAGRNTLTGTLSERARDRTFRPRVSPASPLASPGL
jgi:hypothetical protein